MAKQKLFGNKASPSCSYCENGRLAKTPNGESDQVNCKLYGTVPANHACSKYVYAPLLRVPKKMPALPVYKKSDFEL